MQTMNFIISCNIWNKEADFCFEAVQLPDHKNAQPTGVVGSKEAYAGTMWISGIVKAFDPHFEPNYRTKEWMMPSCIYSYNEKSFRLDDSQTTVPYVSTWKEEKNVHVVSSLSNTHFALPLRDVVHITSTHLCHHGHHPGRPAAHILGSRG